jgi:protein-disulfide isomerase
LALFAILLVPALGPPAMSAGSQAATPAKTNKVARNRIAANAPKAKAPKSTAAEQSGPPNKTMGSRSAPITIEVFSDYQCPACKLFYQETLRPLMDNYVATGKVLLIHRDFPLPIHQYSRQAARLVNAAAKIGKFEKAEEALYTKQAAWEKDGNLTAALTGVLTPAELAHVTQAAESGRMDMFIESDMSLGNSKQVHQTPSLFLTHAGQTDALPPGGVSYSLLKRYLDQLIGQ